MPSFGKNIILPSQGWRVQKNKRFIKRFSTSLPNSYNRSQQNALFLNFILIYNSTCFGQTYCPSLGVLILYSQCDKYQLLWIQNQNSWWWTVSLSETCRVVYQNKVEKQCILLASIIRVCHNARSSECQNQSTTLYNVICCCVVCFVCGAYGPHSDVLEPTFFV